MNYYLSVAFSLLIIIPAITGWVRFKNINPAFLPFLIFIWSGTVNEVYSAIIVTFFRYYNIVNYNIFLLLESIIILWQFKRWNLFKKDQAYYIILVLFTAGWLAETLFITRLKSDFNAYYHIFFSAIIVLLSISMLNHILVKERRNLLTNSIFIICCGFIIMFTYALITESLEVYRAQMGKAFTINLHNLFVIINFIGNLIYTFAIVQMPKKQAFSLEY